MKTRIISIAIFISAALFSIETPCEGRFVQERVYVIATDGIDDKIVKSLKEKLPSSIPVAAAAEIGPKCGLPGTSFDAVRRQYDARAVIDAVSKKVRLALTNERAVVLVDGDLHAGGPDFVYGYADKEKGMAVVSLTRFKNEFYGLKPDSALLKERVLKEAVRQLGKSWGMQDCASARCVIYKSDKIADIDKKRGAFCYKCCIALENRYTGGGLMGPAIKKVL